MKYTLYILAAVLFLSSCSGGLYSHYPKAAPAKKRAASETVTAKKTPIPVPETLAFKVPEANTPHWENVYPEKTLPLTLNKVKEGEKLKIKRNTPQDSTKASNLQITPEDEKVLKRAKTSFILSILGWVGVVAGFLIPGVGFVLIAGSLILEIIALSLGISVLGKIGKSNDIKNARTFATLGIAISVAYFVGLLAILGLILLILLIWL